jgi:plastocyanin
MALARYFGIGALFVGFALTSATGCGSSSSGGTGGVGGTSGSGGTGDTGGTSGTGGTGGTSGTGGTGGTGTGGTGGTGTGGTGGTSMTFMPFKPCETEDAYMAASTVTFSPTMFKYTPACVKVKAGTAVKFSGPFVSHPLRPSAMRGDTDNNPIKATDTGMEASFTFAKAGFYGFFCNFHGPADDGSNMAGMVWVTP